MRRLIIYILVCVALCACSESNSEVDSTQQKVLFNIEVSAPDTRTALVNEDGKYKAIWKEGDFYIVAQIAEKESSFCTGTVEADTPSIKVVAEFEQTEGSSYRYLFASPNLAVSADCTTLGFPLPSRQSPQGMDTFDGAADVILSDVIEFANQPSDQTVTFNTKRVSAVGKVTVKNVALAEGDAVRSIIFACEHPLAGDVTNVVVEDIVAGNDPLTNSIIESASNTITVMLHEPQTGEFTCFFSCLPATLAAGESYIVTLNTEQNHSFVKQAKIPSDLSFTSGRMTTFTVNMAGIVADAPAVDSANCQILYTSTDGNVVTPYATDVFGATIVSNTYENGQGVITFDGEVTKIGVSAFRGCTNLKTLNIPSSVTSIERWAFLDCDSLEEFFGSNIISNGRAVVVNGTMIAFAQGGLTSYALPSEVTAVDVSVFESCDKLTEISLGENINTIGGSAFDSCIGITSITIPQSVTTIGNNAFHSCTKLGTVYVESATPPTGEDYMFNNNAADRKIYVPAASVEAYKSAQYWSDYADAIFADADPANCQILYTSTDGNVVTPNNADAFGANIVSNIYENGQGVITFDSAVTSVGNYAFYKCRNLTSVTIPNGVTLIGNNAFDECSISSIIIPDGVESIGTDAFIYCHNLTEVHIPQNVITLGGNPFRSCNGLAKFSGKYASADGRLLVQNGNIYSFAQAGLVEYTITEPGVNTIGWELFRDCESLVEVTIPQTITKIDFEAFYNCSSLKSVYCRSTTPPILGSKAFGGNATDRKIYVPSGSVDAYKSAQHWSDYADAIVAEVDKPANNQIFYTSTDGAIVTPYDMSAFGANIVSNTYENGLGIIIFDGEVTKIGTDAFCGCQNLTSIVIGDKVTFIGVDAFSGCNNLASVSIPSNVTSIGRYAFCGCSSLVSVTIPNSITTINLGVFKECSNLKSVTIPNSITEIGVSAFSGCSSLTSVTIPDSVLSIGDSAFSECSSLISINIPNSINTLGANPFKGCSKLAEFNGKFASSDKRCLIVEGELNSFASADIIEYTIPYNTTSIGFWAFEDCCNLQLVTIPNSVTLIKNGAFMGCKGLISITIPDSITSIWDYAFRNCNNLRSVYCKPITPPSLGSYVFASSASDCKIYVPAAYVETYKWVWSEYADAIVAEGATDVAVELSDAGTANCYLVNSAGSYKFKSVKGNSLENFSNGYSADVLWESFGTSTTPNVGDLITNVAYKDGYISFSTPATFRSGNASIALRDSSGKILWSWHIWCSAEGWNDQVYPNNAGTMMDRNLGATSATPGDIGAFGLLYQWGRKDPFMGTCAMSESTLVASTGSWDVASSDNMDFAMENPMTFATGWYGGGVAGEGWHTSESEKGLYDPCPVGYRVPDGGANGFWATAFGTSDATSAGTEWDSINYGHHWTLADGTTIAWYPAVGFRDYDSGALSYVGSYGFYWSASPNPSYSSYAYNLFFDNGYVFPADTLNRGNGYSVRCVRE